MIQMRQVQSSNVEAVGYDESKAELYVEFKGSPTYLYVYHGVSKQTYAALLAAESKGGFIGRSIKGIYPVTKKEKERETS